MHEIKIEGMACGHCVMAVKKELDLIANYPFNVEIGKAVINDEDYNKKKELINKAIAKAGYKVVE